MQMGENRIYFAGSIRGGRQDAGLYFQIIHELRTYGRVLTEHVGDDAIAESGERDLSDREIHNRDLRWIDEADIIIGEVSTPSLGVGYEIAYAQSLDKPVYCFFRPNSSYSLSAMIRGSQKIQVFEYRDIKEIKEILQKIFKTRTISG